MQNYEKSSIPASYFLKFSEVVVKFGCCTGVFAAHLWPLSPVAKAACRELDRCHPPEDGVLLVLALLQFYCRVSKKWLFLLIEVIF